MDLKDINGKSYRTVFVPMPKPNLSNDLIINENVWVYLYLYYVKYTYGEIFPARKTMYFDMELNNKT